MGGQSAHWDAREPLAVMSPKHSGIEHQRRKTTVNHDNRVPGLASIRRNRGLSLEQISQTTKISVHVLQAIEEGNLDKLPGGIYTTNYIRQYAQAIEFDASELLGYYHFTTDTDPDTLSLMQKMAEFKRFSVVNGALRRALTLSQAILTYLGKHWSTQGQSARTDSNAPQRS
jgi:cytoskeletal protein RodZ